jgi:asparagine synthase (glutamine-hydrolysing)
MPRPFAGLTLGPTLGLSDLRRTDTPTPSMCGFVGELTQQSEDLAAIAAGLEVLAPRGPDGRGVWTQPGAAFGHRRLKIFDLTPRGNQPMVDPELGLSIVYNGAVYNHRELRHELEQHGHRFFSTADTEVILKGFAEWGPAVVERLQGMFAFGIHERDSGRLTLARDRLGIKPLYWTESDGRFRFASTLPALLATGIDKSIDEVALHHYLSFHSVVPAPRTLLRSVRKLLPGHVMTLDPDGSRSTKRYWRLEYPEAPEERSESQWQQAVLEALRTAVDRRMVSDVPVGVLLSGGLDSSLIVGLLAQAGQKGLSTFSVGFEAAGGEKGDEFEYSDIVARHFETDHHKIFVKADQLLPNLPRCVRAMSEPMVSHDNIGFFLLSAEVAKHVKVIQSGQGADEVFAGYHWYPPMMETEDPVETYRGVFFDRSHEELSAMVPEALRGEDHSLRFVQEHFEAPGAKRAIDKALRLDTTVMLVDDPVKRVDNMTMAWGLEGRVPFLDHELVELAAHVPAELKVRGEGKWVLKEAARQVIPAAVIDRPKGYFPVPALKYLDGPYLEFVKERVLDRRATERGLIDRAHVEMLLRDPAAHITPLRGSKLWQVALLEIWMQEHGI